MRIACFIISLFCLLFVSSGCNKDDGCDKEEFDAKSLPELKGTSWRGIYTHEQWGRVEEWPVSIFFITDKRGNYELLLDDVSRNIDFDYSVDGRVLTISAVSYNGFSYTYLNGDWLLTGGEKDNMELINGVNNFHGRKILRIGREY